MKRYPLSFILIFLISGCCKDVIENTYTLNNYDKAIIPYTTSQEQLFTDNNGVEVLALSTPRISIIDARRDGPDSCRITEIEEVSSTLTFSAIDLTLDISVTADIDRAFGINTLTSMDTYYQSSFQLSCKAVVDMPLEAQVTTYSKHDFDFENVYVFQDCRENSSIENIVFSVTRGVQFITFTDGRYLKLND
ncbi:hypothetical protein Celal_1453 [Cellulophaga algicola DSM 14237]|uniref:Lipoprotein n=1 Tax=Cellulophaga algicola (strain DSM 14237 / IC166 / ACAM 630) TaxID=688270 RepID=E6X9L5_CELAD|nr:hypothetical protein [Cellulophaga algicola]ADV48765.1 hypothetical protein Celal_1453 [Cellulophaga algicola DSM 14237]